MFKFIRLFCLVAATVFAFSCGNKIPADFDYGHISDGVYQNDFFDFSIVIPEECYVFSSEQTEQLRQVGMDMILDDDKSKDAIIKAVDVQSATILNLTEVKDGEVGGYNLNIAVENLKAHPNITDGRKYLTSAIETMKQIGMPYESFDNPIEETTLGGKRFYCKDLVMHVGEVRLSQKMYCTVDKSFGFLITVTWSEPYQQAELQKALESIKYGNAR